jgi:hypothetical protein
MVKKVFDESSTQKVIDKLLASPQCMDSLKSVPCEDYKDLTQLGLVYQARFGAFIRVKHGNIVINLVDWPKVATVVNSHV